MKIIQTDGFNSYYKSLIASDNKKILDFSICLFEVYISFDLEKELFGHSQKLGFKAFPIDIPISEYISKELNIIHDEKILDELPHPEIEFYLEDVPFEEHYPSLHYSIHCYKCELGYTYYRLNDPSSLDRKFEVLENSKEFYTKRKFTSFLTRHRINKHISIYKTILLTIKQTRNLDSFFEILEIPKTDAFIYFDIFDYKCL